MLKCRWYIEYNGQSFGLSFWFVFFKQKTAYEMRISDWSSDVCSSDLEIALRQGCRDADAALEGECVGEGGALHEGDEPRARQFFKRLEVVVLTKADGRDFADRKSTRLNSSH